jgi:hypothetical protein
MRMVRELCEVRFGCAFGNDDFAGETARVQTPRYVRDNIHVSLLAKAFAAFVGASPAPGTVRRLNPSGYVGRLARISHTGLVLVTRLAAEPMKKVGVVG